MNDYLKPLTAIKQYGATSGVPAPVTADMFHKTSWRPDSQRGSLFNSPYFQAFTGAAQGFLGSALQAPAPIDLSDMPTHKGYTTDAMGRPSLQTGGYGRQVAALEGGIQEYNKGQGWGNVGANAAAGFATGGIVGGVGAAIGTGIGELVKSNKISKNNAKLNSKIRGIDGYWGYSEAERLEMNNRKARGGGNARNPDGSMYKLPQQSYHKGTRDHAIDAYNTQAEGFYAGQHADRYTQELNRRRSQQFTNVFGIPSQGYSLLG